MSREVLVFDGDCGFCTWSAARIQRWAAGALDVVPWQLADLAALGLTQAQCSASVQFVDADGVASGGAAVARALLRCREPWRTVGRALAMPLMRPFVERGYVVVAANRHRLPGATPACALHGDEGRLAGPDGDGPGVAVAPSRG
jgi:predicted DCC family thiol-disulfide oxidoreductase YuxK